MTTGDVAAVIATTTAYGRGMAELGHAADVPIVTEKLRQIAALALSRPEARPSPPEQAAAMWRWRCFPTTSPTNAFTMLCRE